MGIKTFNLMVKLNGFLIKILFIIILIFISLPPIKSQLGSKNIPEQQQQQIEEYEVLAEKSINNKNANNAATYFNKIAYIYWMNGFSSEAIDYFQKSLKQNQIINNLNGIKSIYTNIGGIYSDEEEYEKAIDYFRKSLEISRKLENKKEISSGLLNIAVTFAELQQYEKSNKYLEKSLSIAQEENDFKLMRNCYGLLSENYEKMGDAEKSLEYFNFYTAFEKRIQKEALNKTVKSTRKEMEVLKSRTIQAEEEKVAKEKKLVETQSFLKEVEETSREQQLLIDFLNQEKILRQKIFRRTVYSAVGGGLLLAIIALIIYRGYKHKKKANAQLASQNKAILEQQNEINRKNLSITNSINYAQRIQRAMLPEKDNLANFLEDSFILLKPRDIVSGDFYWFSDTNLSSVITNVQDGVKNNLVKEKKLSSDKFIISAVDCTGHGVPGAFMSMIGCNLINEIISHGITEPHHILNVLHKGIRNALKQETTENRDGMDMTLCVIKTKEKIVEFVGAKNPLVYVIDDQLYEIKGDKMSIGGFQRPGMERNFTKHTVKIDQPTSFYIYSDGFADQIGGENGEKYLSKNFKKLLVEISREPMDKQKEILEETLIRWQGDRYKQVDDILVIGFKC